MRSSGRSGSIWSSAATDGTSVGVATGNRDPNGSAVYRGAKTLLVGACNNNGIFYAWRRGNLSAGPVWQRTIGTPNSRPTPCIGSAAYDATSLYVALGPTTLGARPLPGRCAP